MKQELTSNKPEKTNNKQKWPLEFDSLANHPDMIY